MAACYIEAMRRIQPQGPYAVVGYSYGAWIAFEVARQLVARGERISLIGIVDVGMDPARARSIGRIPRDALVFAHNLLGWVRYNIMDSSPGVIAAKMRNKARVASRRFGIMRGTIDRRQFDLDPDNIYGLENMPHSLRQDTERHLRLWQDYVPSVSPLRVTLFRARSRNLFSPPVEPDLGWGRFASLGVEIEVIPGNHDGVIREPHVQVLAQRIRDHLPGSSN